VKKFSFGIFAALIAFVGCAAVKSAAPDLITDNTITLSVEPGAQWQGRMKFFIFSVKKMPQLAAWIEDGNGMYISTITITNRGAKKNWRSAPEEGRPEALPVWNQKIQNNATQHEIDAVSSATSKGSVEAQINDGLLINGQEYHVYLEVNHSYDYNETYPESITGVNGQPSALYHAQFIAGQSGTTSLAPLGRGSVDGSNGTITKGLEGLTTALEIIKSAYVISNGAIK
jgi:hypothetical protein